MPFKDPHVGPMSPNHKMPRQHTKVIGAVAKRTIMAKTVLDEKVHYKEPLLHLLDMLEQLDKIEIMIQNGELPKRDMVDVFEQRCRVFNILMPYILPKIATTVVQHNINTDEPDADKARESLLKLMHTLRDQ